MLVSMSVILISERFMSEKGQCHAVIFKGHGAVRSAMGRKARSHVQVRAQRPPASQQVHRSPITLPPNVHLHLTDSMLGVGFWKPTGG